MIEKVVAFFSALCLTVDCVNGNESKMAMQEFVDQASPDLPNLTRVSGKGVAISPYDVSSEIYYYTITGGWISRNQNGTTNKLLLFVECGSRFRDWRVKEIEFRQGSIDQGWYVLYFWEGILKKGQVESAEQKVELWWP